MIITSKQRPYKKSSKANKKRSVVKEHESGMLLNTNSRKRFPVVHLPEIITCPILQSYRRYVNNGSASSTDLTIYQCLAAFTVATTTTNVTPIIKAFRIKRVRVLSPVTTQGTSVTVKLEPATFDSTTNSFNSVPEVYVDTSASIDIPAYISLEPSLDSPLGSWHWNRQVDASLLELIAPAGSTLDILFEYILGSDSTASAGSTYQRTVAGATVGVAYAGPIALVFVPVGVTSI
jgi:hypothetical protein